jgi:hypothetical protein
MPRRPAPLTVQLALAAAVASSVVLSVRDARAQEARGSEHYTVRAELGGEIDTNAHRTEEIRGVQTPAPVVSPVARAVLAGSISDVLGDDHQVALTATVATKVFTNDDARGEDVAVIDSGASWRKPLDPRWAVAVTAGYYDAFQRDVPSVNNVFDRRDFRSITPTMRLSRAFGDSVDVGAGGGYRLFTFKPDHTYDFQSPTAVLDARWARETADGAADWEVALRAGYERRLFEGRQLVENTTCTTAPACAPITGPEGRLDDFLTSALDVARTGRVLMGAGYGLQVNRSNSFGESVLRHVVTARFAAALPLDLYLAARIEILIARYSDQVYVAQAGMDAAKPWVTIEDENRNSARVELSRNLGDRLQLIARYTFYANELSRNNDVSYRRQTALLSLSYAVEK